MVEFGRNFVEQGINDITDHCNDDTNIARRVRSIYKTLRDKMDQLSFHDQAIGIMPGWGGWDMGWE
jgi:hypothetical protein